MHRSIYPRAYNPPRGEHWAGNHHTYQNCLSDWKMEETKEKKPVSPNGKYVQSNNTYIKIYSLNFSSPAHLIPKKKPASSSVSWQNHTEIFVQTYLIIANMELKFLHSFIMKCNFNVKCLIIFIRLSWFDSVKISEATQNVSFWFTMSSSKFFSSESISCFGLNLKRSSIYSVGSILRINQSPHWQLSGHLLNST